MVVDLGEAEVLVREVAELVEGAVHGEVSLLHPVEELLESFDSYGDLLVETPHYSRRTAL